MKKWKDFFGEVAYRFCVGFILIAAILVPIVVIISLDGRYLESTSKYNGRPTSRAFYEKIIKTGDYKTLAFYIGIMSSLGGAFFLISIPKEQLPWKQKDKQDE